MADPLQNLTHTLTEADLRKGGQNSGKTRRMKKTFRMVLSDALSRQITDEEAKRKLESLGYDGTVLDMINQAQIERASSGDVESARFIRDTIGERPASGVEITNIDGPVSEMDLSKLSDDDLMRAIERRKQR